MADRDGLAHLFGGERELGALVLPGDAGVGKSSLVAAAAARATERGFRVLSAAQPSEA